MVTDTPWNECLVCAAPIMGYATCVDCGQHMGIELNAELVHLNTELSRARRILAGAQSAEHSALTPAQRARLIESACTKVQTFAAEIDETVARAKAIVDRARHERGEMPLHLARTLHRAFGGGQ